MTTGVDAVSACGIISAIYLHKQSSVPLWGSPMLGKVLNNLTGTDDLERIALKGNPALLNTYLKKRPVLVPQRPRRFLDAADFTQEQLNELIREDSEELPREHFEPWILNVDGKRRLPVFSSQKTMQEFAGKISQDMNRVFGLGFISVLLETITKQIDFDFVDLNAFSKRSWEISIGRTD